VTAQADDGARLATTHHRTASMYPVGEKDYDVSLSSFDPVHR
jgi:hypothetical protein